MPMTASGRIAAAGAGGGSVAGMLTATTGRPSTEAGGAGRDAVAAEARPLSGPLQTRKLRWRPSS